MKKVSKNANSPNTIVQNGQNSLKNANVMCKMAQNAQLRSLGLVKVKSSCWWSWSRLPITPPQLPAFLKRGASKTVRFVDYQQPLHSHMYTTTDGAKPILKACWSHELLQKGHQGRRRRTLWAAAGHAFRQQANPAGGKPASSFWKVVLSSLSSILSISSCSFVSREIWKSLSASTSPWQIRPKRKSLSCS